MCIINQSLCICQSSIIRFNVHVIRDVVTMVMLWRWVPRSNPDRINAKFLQVRKFRANTLYISNAITITVGKRANVDLVGNRVAPPWTLTTWGKCRTHYFFSSRYCCRKVRSSSLRGRDFATLSSTATWTVLTRAHKAPLFLIS